MATNQRELKPADMTDSQRECYALLCDLMGGAHHVPKVKECGFGICANIPGGLATWDFCCLTRLVILCHDRCIRGEVSQGGPGSICLSLHKRQARDGSTYERHPTLEDAIAMHRGDLSCTAQES